jgi:hypothetical protein
MPKKEDIKNQGNAQAERERELRELIERVETQKSESTSPEKESPHDYIERRMRTKPRKDADK